MAPGGIDPFVRQEAAARNSVAPGEKPGSDNTRSARPVDQSSGSNASNRTADKKESDDKPARREQSNGQSLEPDELKELTELKARDREVRAHEAAHQAVGGQYAGSMSFTYERGPDGAQYAVGGEVPIDVSPVEGDPESTIEKMRVVRAAAMAPAQPSAQDRAVAAQAMQSMLQAQAEMALGEEENENALSVFA